MTHPRHVVYVVSEMQKSLAFEWIAAAFKNEYKLTFILLNPATSQLEDFLIRNNIEVRRIPYHSKKDLFSAFCKVLWYFLSQRPHIVHAHLFIAQMVALPAARCAFIRKRIYTRHNSNYHHAYAPKGVRYDLWSNQLATHIISISQATFKTLVDLEKVDRKKIRQIYHGFRLSVFQDTRKDKVQLLMTRWKIPEASPRIGVIARHIEWKGIQFIIPAFQRLLKRYPSAILVLANAHGPYHDVLLEHLAEISKSNYVLISFEEDIASLYAVFDIYVHTPVDELSEAFGQTYVEALAAEVPSIFTKSGVAAEFIEHRRNAWVVDYQSSNDIYKAMVAVLDDKELQQRMKQAGRQSVSELFDVDLMVSNLRKLYDE